MIKFRVHTCYDKLFLLRGEVRAMSSSCAANKWDYTSATRLKRVTYYTNGHNMTFILMLFILVCVWMTDMWSHKLVVLKLYSVVHRKPLNRIVLLSPCPPPILTWRQMKYIRYISNNTLPHSQLLYLLYFPTLGWTEMAYVVSNGKKGRD